MLSKNIEFNFLNKLKKIKPSLSKKSDSESKRATTIEETDLRTKMEGFAVGFFTVIALVALILSIAFVL